MKYQGNDKFTRQTVRSLNKLSNGKSETATSMVNELHESDNTFTIKSTKDNSSFDAGSLDAYANPISDLNNIQPGKGSGGSIFWNMDGQMTITDRGVGVDATMDLAHELAHASDANQGVLSNKVVDGLTLKEWRACATANTIRGEFGKPLQTVYGGTVQVTSGGWYNPVPNTGVKVVSGGKPILPFHRINRNP